MAMQKITVELPEDLKRSLQNIANKRGVSMSAVAREALRTYLDSDTKPQWPRSIGMVADGSINAADVDHYLEEQWLPFLEAECGSSKRS